MKRKLKIVMVLAAIALTGIIIFQAYWSINAYKLNKQQFDRDINTAMQRAMDSCKRDYFDSIRKVMVYRLSDTAIHIKLDTIIERDTAHPSLNIMVSDKYTSFGQPYHMLLGAYDFYRRKLPHKATTPEILTEMSFYVPSFLDRIEMLLSMQDIASHFGELQGFLQKHKNEEPSDSLMAHNRIIKHGVYELPQNFRQADSLKISKYYRAELNKLHPKASFKLSISDKPIPPKTADPHHVDDLRYSETDEVNYKYHGFLFLQHTSKNQLFVRAVFDRAQAGLLKEMLAPLLFSALLIVFTIFCFIYIIRTIINQKRLTELKDDFINNMTHELKTPIATISVAIEGMQKYNALDDPDKTARYLQTCRNELGRLNDLVNKVLNIAAFESHDIPLNKEWTDIDGLMSDLVNSETLKADKQVDISFENTVGVKSVFADKLHLRNILANLIDNAVKYCAEPVVIRIILSKNGNYAEFIVKDNGIGIPAEHLGQIFDKFHRVPSGNVHDVKGTGLGLNYVKHMVEAHGGKVDVKSVVGNGTSVSFTLPLSND
ncbi:hypothetical protein FPZ42_13670 [Mucilaginibacter achroorhodeus]|uniref:histidine kinase n=1 Tax=Mucilaginibacter achroorhodeus TaxID=2599294 RepID=A0A563U2R5_9SPHI|nr:HAMP domain-containing sensor histidine kinase [Mucilaginibacter achroorhodeus]TWR25636.1 hypothetical protein FPZ42_13670 [Mucilaginibacter achroorhodeus]